MGRNEHGMNGSSAEEHGTNGRSTGKRGASERVTPGPRDRGRIDKRVARSRKTMVEAFEHLLTDKPYEDISVTDIARSAGVDRKTFYKHFGSIDGLLSYMLDQYIEDIVDSAHALLTQRGEIADHSLKMRLSAFFDTVNKELMENITVNRRVFECVPFDLMLTCVKRSMWEELERYAAVPESIPRELLDYYLSFVFGGILSTYRQWIVRDDVVPVEKVSDVVSSLVATGLSAFSSEADERLLGASWMEGELASIPARALGSRASAT